MARYTTTYCNILASPNDYQKIKDIFNNIDYFESSENLLNAFNDYHIMDEIGAETFQLFLHYLRSFLNKHKDYFYLKYKNQSDFKDRTAFSNKLYEVTGNKVYDAVQDIINNLTSQIDYLENKTSTENKETNWNQIKDDVIDFIKELKEVVDQTNNLENNKKYNQESNLTKDVNTKINEITKRELTKIIKEVLTQIVKEANKKDTTINETYTENEKLLYDKTKDNTSSTSNKSDNLTINLNEKTIEDNSENETAKKDGTQGTIQNKNKAETGTAQTIENEIIARNLVKWFCDIAQNLIDENVQILTHSDTYTDAMGNVHSRTWQTVEGIPDYATTKDMENENTSTDTTRNENTTDNSNEDINQTITYNITNTKDTNIDKSKNKDNTGTQNRLINETINKDNLVTYNTNTDNEHDKNIVENETENKNKNNDYTKDINTTENESTNKDTLKTENTKQNTVSDFIQDIIQKITDLQNTNLNETTKTIEKETINRTINELTKYEHEIITNTRKIQEITDNKKNKAVTDTKENYIGYNNRSVGALKNDYDEAILDITNEFLDMSQELFMSVW